MEYSMVRNGVWVNDTGTAINCEVMFTDFKDWLPFTATETDCTEHGKNIFQELKAGKYGAIQPYSESPDDETVNTGIVLHNLMIVANGRIQPLEDAVELGMATASEKATLKAWKIYRVLLSRIDPAAPDIIWPEAPQH